MAAKKKPDAERQSAWLELCLRVEHQCLLDVHYGDTASVGFLCHPEGAVSERWLDDAAEQGLSLGFCVARLNLLASRGFDSLDALLRAQLRALRGPWDRGDGEGLASVLRCAGEAAGDTVETLQSALREPRWHTPLPSLCAPLLAPPKRGERHEAALRAWLEGSTQQAGESSTQGLEARTAHAALGELAAMVRLLGARGLLLLHGGGEVLAKLPEGRRARAWGVLRELIDNADGARHLRSTRVLVAGTTALFAGPRSLAADPALAGRVLSPLPWPPGSLAPHRPWVDLAVDPNWTPSPEAPVPLAAPPERADALRALVRATQGLPVTEPRYSLSVGHDAIDAVLDRLFEVTAMDGSVFAVLSGDFGAGKTHSLLHLTERALRDARPVLRLSLERLDMDLGNPQRHLRRLLEHASLPLPGRPTMLEWLSLKLRMAGGREALEEVLASLAAEGGDLRPAAEELRKRLGRLGERARVALLESWLGAGELVAQEATPAARRAAYLRLLLWMALLERLEGTGGPVLVLDEVEALFRGAATKAERRTALRSLAFYCGGTLPRTLVMLAITPNALDQLRAEAPEQLEALAATRSLLPWEDVAMLRRRLRDAPTLEPARLTGEDAVIVAARLATLYAQTRGRPAREDLPELARALWSRVGSPRPVVRGLADALERSLWSSGA